EGRRYVETAAHLASEGKLQLATGNAHVMRLVREGQCAFGWTDTDDFEAARRFVDWALRPEIEAELAASRSAQVPVRASVPRPAHVVDGRAFKAMQVDLGAVGARIEARIAQFQE